MNAQLRKGLIVAAIHLAMVAGLGAKLLIDRAARPRVWARTAPIDPDDPLRGRYVRLRVEGAAHGFGDDAIAQPVVLAARDGLLALVGKGTESVAAAMVGCVVILVLPGFYRSEPDPAAEAEAV